MKSISLSSRELNHLKKYNFDSFTCHSESVMYEMMLDKKYLLKISKDFLKYGYELSRDKRKNVEFLNDLNSGISSLMIPEYFVYVDQVLAGVAIEKIENTKNLGAILNDFNASTAVKLKYLKKVGNLLYNIDINNLDFVIGDLHSYNFLVDENDELYVVDLDSIYLPFNRPLKTYYFSNFKVLNNTSVFPSKYHIFNDRIYPDMNSDLLCYNYMLINALASKNMHFLEISDYLKYISYLEEIGYGENIIKSFKNVYSNRDNINPVLYFDEIRHELDSKYSSYKAKVLK